MRGALCDIYPCFCSTGIYSVGNRDRSLVILRYSCDQEATIAQSKFRSPPFVETIRLHDILVQTPLFTSANLAGRYQLAYCSLRSHSIQILWRERSADVRCLCCTVTLTIGSIQRAFCRIISTERRTTRISKAKPHIAKKWRFI